MALQFTPNEAKVVQCIIRNCDNLSALNIDWESFARDAGYTSLGGARNAWSNLRKKLAATEVEGTEGGVKTPTPRKRKANDKEDVGGRNGDKEANGKNKRGRKSVAKHRSKVVDAEAEDIKREAQSSGEE